MPAKKKSPKSSPKKRASAKPAARAKRSAGTPAPQDPIAQALARRRAALLAR